MKDIFISYAHEDRVFAKRLASLLEQVGFSVWWDPHLRAGDDFAQVIENTLKQVRCVLVLWSRHSVESHWVRAEASEGLRLAKLVPIALDAIEPPLVFRPIHTLCLPAADLRADGPEFERLVKDLRARIGTHGVETETAPETEPPITTRLRQPLIWGGAMLAGLLFAWSGVAAMLLDRLTGVFGGLSSVFVPSWVELSIGLFAAISFILSWRVRRKPWGQAITSGAIIVLIAIGLVWTQRLHDPLPDHLVGKIMADDWRDLRVAALDVHGNAISMQVVPVNESDGGFGMRLRATFADRPRSVVVTGETCGAIRYAVSWQTWREGADLLIQYRCD